MRKKYFPTINGVKWTFATNKTTRDGKEEKIAIHRLALIPIERHIKIKGASSPDDPTLTEYWKNRQTTYGKTYWSKGTKMYLVAENQGWKCPVCGEHLFNEEKLHTHHKVRVKDGGSDKVNNLAHLHKSCHKHVHTGNRSARQKA